MKKQLTKPKTVFSQEIPQILIVSDNDFVSHFLCQRLLAQNCQIVYLVNFSETRKENVKTFLDKKNFTFIQADLTKSLEHLKLPRFNYIFYLNSLENLREKNFLTLLKAKNSKFLVVVPFFQIDKSLESLIIKKFKKDKIDYRLVKILDVYGPGMSLKQDNKIADFFNSLQKKMPLRVPIESAKVLYPTFIDDLVYGLLKAMFSQDSTNKAYTLANTQEITLLNLAKTLKEISGLETGIMLTTPKPQKQVFLNKEMLLKNQEELNWYPKIELRTGLKKTLKWLKGIKKTRKNEVTAGSKTLEKEERQLLKPILKAKRMLSSEASVKPKKHKSLKNKLFNIVKVKFVKKFKIKKINKAVFIFLALFLIILFLPLFSFTYYCQKEDFQKGKRILLEFNFLTFPFKKQRKEVLSLLTLGSHFSSLEKNKQEIIRHFYKLGEIVIKGKRGDSQEEIRLTGIYLDQMWQDLSLMETELNNLNLANSPSFFLSSLKSKLKDFQKGAPVLRKRIALAKESLRILPEILAFKDKKTYLVLLQDNMELRPTGGFISSFGLLTFEKGKLLDFETESIYTVDSQLQGHVEPPEQIKKYLGENNWFLRDSNWDPNFPNSARQAEWFLEKEINRKTDGTIAFTLNFIQDMLKIFGPIQLLDYNETITSENFFERGVYYSEIDFSSGTGKKDFFHQLMLLLFEKIKQSDENGWLKLLGMAEKDLNEKQLLISFHQGRGDLFFKKNNWNGALRQQRPIQTGLTDYLMLVEANLSVNKTNFFLKRRLKQEVTILESGELIEILNIDFENKSPSQNKPGGDYKNYQRVYIPAESELLSIEIGSDENSLIPLSEDRIDLSQIDSKQVLGFLLTVPVKERRMIKIIYKLKNKIKLKNNSFSYLFFWQKQPGIKGDSLEFIVNFPSFIRPVKIAPMAKVNKYQIVFSSNTTKDNAFFIDFKR